MAADELDASDLAELEHRLAAVDDELSSMLGARLVARLAPLIARRIPARVVETVPGLPRARVRFADGTAVLVHGVRPGDVGVLAAWLHQGSVVPSRCTLAGDGARLELLAPGRRARVCVCVDGLDQPD